MQCNSEWNLLLFIAQMALLTHTSLVILPVSSQTVLEPALAAQSCLRMCIIFAMLKTHVVPLHCSPTVDHVLLGVFLF